MAEVLLFHHVMGLTNGVQSFAQALRDGGHTVHVPDLFDGRRPGSIDEGMQLVREVGDEPLLALAEHAALGLPPELVYAGFSFGAGLAQTLAQTRTGTRGALLFESCLPVTGEWAIGPWPEGVAVQIHGMDNDPYFALGGDLDAARELVALVGPALAELFVYPGDRHLFADSSLPSFDAEAAALLTQHALEFLDRLG